MRLNQFKKEMKKDIFTKEEAQLVALSTSPNTLRLQLHQWLKAGELIPIKRGLYSFSDRRLDKITIASSLYFPCYISLESALNTYGIIPDIPFATTLVTTKGKKEYETPFGRFVYHKIKRQAFFGYDPDTLMAEKEKALLDYLYINARRLRPDQTLWRELRFQNLDVIDFKKTFTYAEIFGSQRLLDLLRSVEKYATTA